MKEKIERLSNGEFEYEQPYINLSVEEIRINVESGKSYEGSFTISNSINRKMKGVVYSSSRFFTLKNNTFIGAINTLTYQLNAAYLNPGDTIKGEVNIISDCGERSLPFSVHVEAPYCLTSVGKVGDLFQFTNLARMDWTEAKKVFRSEDFERVILRDDEKYKVTYKNLVKSISTSQALEEFLIAIHKKSKIFLSIDKTLVEYSVNEDELMDKLILTKDHWGYAEIRVSTDVPFIQLEQKFVWADRFIGNTHQISYVLNPEFMRPGKNYGRIWIKTVHQTIIVDVVCSYHKGGEDNKEHRSIRQMEYLLTKNYLDFRTERIHLTDYLVKTEDLLEKITVREDSNLVGLMKIHLAIISGKSKVAGQLLEELAKNEVILRKKSTVEYCAYLYLDALYHKDEDTIRYVTDTIRRFYSSGNFDWRILWFLLYTDKRYDKNKSLKLADIKEQLVAGCHSPILYFEAVCIYNEEPFQLRGLGYFEIQALNFGIKYKLLSTEVVKQYTYLANKLKNFHPVIFKGLTRLYREYKDTEILSAICCILIKGLKRSSKYFEWYRLGVEEQLRITELYEYYMYSIDDEAEVTLAQPVLLYFIYNSNINEKKLAFLYANIIKNKDNIEAIYRSYYKKMEVFARKQLEAHNISRDLAVLYKEFIDKERVDAEVANLLPHIMFKHELVCTNPNMVGVTVFHKELDEEDSQPLIHGKAIITLFNKNAEIFFTDAFGNRYTASIDYKMKSFLPPEDYEDCIAPYCNHPMLLLHLFERYHNNRVLTDHAISLRKQVLEIDGLKEAYVIRCLMTLIEYYFENYNEELLEQYLLSLDLNKIKTKERIKFLEYMVMRGHYDKALEALETFGFEGVAVNRLVKLCSGWLTHTGMDSKKDILLNLCHYVFIHGKYDDTILKYLVAYYHGPTAAMFTIWKAAKGFEMETHQLEERLLVHMLFAESYVQDSFMVFQEYYKNVSNRILVKAYLTYNAYKYLVHDRVINEELFPIMRREINYEENDICLFAWLKYNAKNQELSETDISFIDFHLHRLEKKGIVLPFFPEFEKFVKLPERIINKCYIEYKTDIKKQVYIHYRILRNDSENDYITERLPNVFLGIHVKEFMLFYNEVLQYYITEESEDDVTITESFHVHYDKEVPEEEESKFNQINLMLMAMEMKDEMTLLELMENYIKSEYIISKNFEPLN
ncbi:hypothetical protein I5677_11475 [Mobilitalea sibirica]|uniref:DUF5717 domain-containing protein n=1 Tax=Mobilitalea sibirica TaxID=1462919 RepID=A0A8J7GZV6_9FIRM|nr:DUF5717 family protein [Mobilitalea sibirica]MBH1941514.1 hypothetical protein [Mobilitalea sibirica]